MDTDIMVAFCLGNLFMAISAKIAWDWLVKWSDKQKFEKMNKKPGA